MAEQKQCKQCGEEFEISDRDIEFLKKISLQVANQTLEIPPAMHCPECREIRRLVWRNERSLYKHKCDKTGEEVVSIYSPDKTDYKVYSNAAWRKDDWDATEFAKDYDESKTFFEQFNELVHAVPRQATNSTRNENSEFCNQTWQTKDSYLCFNVGYCENCYYCTEAFHVKDCVDCFDIRNCELSYGLFDCGGCNNSMFLEHCKDCSECYFTYGSSGCRNVFMSNGLHNKQYIFENKQLTKEEYETKIKEVDLGKRSILEEYKTKFGDLKKSVIHKATNNINSENCTGDYLTQCNDCIDCYNAIGSEGCTRVAGIDDASKDCSDMNIITEAELCYEGTSTTGNRNLFGVFVVYGSNNLYCNFCEQCTNCFGCVGLNHKDYCILNKQYTKEEYEELLLKIVEKMKVDGEWGEFFPMSLSPFGYNEALISSYNPKSKEEAISIGAKWQDNEYSPQFSGEAYQPKDDIKEYVESEPEVQKLLASVIKCEDSGKAFKIMPQELAFYMKQGIPIPSKHSETRYKELFILRNPRKLYKRQCMCEQSGHDHEGRCPNEFETTYAPDRSEKVYCESCYQKSVI